MSQDTKNSIALWVVGITTALVAWASVRFDFAPNFSQPVRDGITALYLIEFVALVVCNIWKRRHRDEKVKRNG